MPASDPKSKRPSGANLPSPHKPSVFFIDRSLGRKIIAGALRKAGEDVQVHDDHFPPDARDEEWLAEIGKRGWIALSKDTRIRYRANELKALRAAKVCAFVLTARGDLQGKEIAAIFVKALPAMKRLVAKTRPPFIAHVSRDGSVRLVTP